MLMTDEGKDAATAYHIVRQRLGCATLSLALSFRYG
jgi:hypothetical protein